MAPTPQLHAAVLLGRPWPNINALAQPGPIGECCLYQVGPTLSEYATFTGVARQPASALSGRDAQIVNITYAGGPVVNLRHACC